MIVDARYRLPKSVREKLQKQPVQWGFGTLSEAVYYRTYSRELDGFQETWPDTVIRVVEGVMSIRQDWVVNKMGKRWNARRYDLLAEELADAIFAMKFLPPGRGLWAMGTEYVHERGSHALNNCAYIDVTDSLAIASRWLMDSLMCGVGVGFGTVHAQLRRGRMPKGEATTYVVPDTKEGWAESVKRLVQSYEKGGRPMLFDYSAIRKEGELIRGFGGISSGYKPLEKCHERIRSYMTSYVNGDTDATRVIVDVMNSIGACVVAGNVRRSAELAVGSPYDGTFASLKDYERFPERKEIGGMSNNSLALETVEDFTFLGLPEYGLAERIADNGEPGLLNLLNVQKYGRYGHKLPDAAVGVNPCGEIPLESFELCNLAEVIPTRCTPDELPRVFELATFYASTVSLLRSHSPETNEVVARNRRIGVSVTGIADWIDTTNLSNVIGHLNHGYDLVRAANAKLAHEAGVAPSIRVTTVKPSGTVSLLAGVSSGMHFPMGGYVLRRVRIGNDSPVTERLIAAGIPHEPDAVSDGTEVFEFPLRYGQGRTRAVKHVSVWEQASIVAMLQRFWADNAVSNTLTVQPAELGQIDRVLAVFAGQVKSLSMLPDKDGGAYTQMPIEHLSKPDFETRSAALGKINWSGLHGSDGDAIGEAYCQGDACEVPQPM
jgi:ribonucleoside-diphosphate reductase alpha chain